MHRTLPALRHLQIWIYHHNDEEPEAERRPMVHGKGDNEQEQRHQRLFDVLRTIQVPDFALCLSWNPRYVLDPGDCPFKVNLWDWYDISGAIDQLPEQTVTDLYD
jgi:hypothetical protein